MTSIPVEDDIPMEIADGDVVLDEQLDDDSATELRRQNDMATVGPGNSMMIVDQIARRRDRRCVRRAARRRGAGEAGGLARRRTDAGQSSRADASARAAGSAGARAGARSDSGGRGCRARAGRTCRESPSRCRTRLATNPKSRLRRSRSGKSTAFPSGSWMVVARAGTFDPIDEAALDAPEPIRDDPADDDEPIAPIEVSADDVEETIATGRGSADDVEETIAPVEVAVDDVELAQEVSLRRSRSADDDLRSIDEIGRFEEELAEPRARGCRRAGEASRAVNSRAVTSPTLPAAR